ncbi:MAG: Gfo/Idh/MocA family protein [Fimbriimonas sp.]
MGNGTDGFSRRDLLMAAGALSLTSLEPVGKLLAADRDQQPEKPVGFAILGLGSYAQNQIMPSFADCKKAKLVAVISGTPDKAKRVAERYNLPPTAIYNYENLENIKNNPEIEVVYIISPPSTHRDFTLRSAAAGKHVCSEKPMEATSKACQEMIDACKKAGKLLQIGYRSHYQNHNLRAMEICRSGQLGPLRSLISEHGFNMPNGTWRTKKSLAGGGALWDIGIYALQAVQYLAGTKPTEVVALRHDLKEDRFKDVDDVSHFALSFPNGCLANCATGYSWAGANNYRVMGQYGRLEADPATGYSGHQLRLNGRLLEIADNNQFAAQMDHFADCIRNQKPVRTPGEMGLQDIRILEAILLSAREGRSVKIV